MSRHDDRAFAEQVVDALQAHAEGLDEAGAARLAQARRRALAGQPARAPLRLGVWPGAGLAAGAALVLVAVLSLQSMQRVPEAHELWMTQEDIELIEDLDFYAWLDALESNG